MKVEENTTILKAVRKITVGTKEQIKIHAPNGVDQFSSRVNNLTRNGFLFKTTTEKETVYSLTQKGIDRMDKEDGIVRIEVGKRAQSRNIPMSKINYVPTIPVMRPGSQDALKYPSRMGDKLVYRADAQTGDKT